MGGGRSINRVQCGSYLSANNSRAVSTFTCGEPANGYIAPHKEQLGWIPPANLVTTDTQTGGTWTIEGGALPLGAPIKMIKVCLPGLCGNPDALYLTVEARVKGLGATSQFDNDIPGEGVILHDVVVGRTPVSGPCFGNSHSGWAVPIDATPGDDDTTNCTFAPGTALFNAQWTPGQTYTDNQFGVSIAVLSRVGSSFSVSVTPAPATVSPGAFSKSTPPSGTTGLPDYINLGWGSSRAATRYDIASTRPTTMPAVGGRTSGSQPALGSTTCRLPRITGRCVPSAPVERRTQTRVRLPTGVLRRRLRTASAS